MINGEFLKVKKLGKGSFGDVILVKSIKNKKVFKFKTNFKKSF